ncbi:MAG: anti-virulence regulator CigR family protein, partial [Pseudomonas sp.]
MPIFRSITAGITCLSLICGSLPAMADPGNGKGQGNAKGNQSHNQDHGGKGKKSG